MMANTAREILALSLTAPRNGCLVVTLAGLVAVDGEGAAADQVEARVEQPKLGREPAEQVGLNLRTNRHHRVREVDGERFAIASGDRDAELVDTEVTEPVVVFLKRYRSSSVPRHGGRASVDRGHRQGVGPWIPCASCDQSIESLPLKAPTWTASACAAAALHRSRSGTAKTVSFLMSLLKVFAPKKPEQDHCLIEGRTILAENVDLQVFQVP